ncbi:unnamed protein product [Brassica rapa]|uniref:Uncharacterized protein n=1 Tax=Brassica campestris TaxID=3711 RepID=A0A8D9LSD7_BRACM|nr:unnamed protein product [Brassica rapa]
MFYQIQPYRPLSKIRLRKLIKPLKIPIPLLKVEPVLMTQMETPQMLCWLLEQIWTTGSFCIPKDVFETSKEADEIGAARGVSVEQCLSVYLFSESLIFML